MIDPRAFTLLAELDANNNKAWVDAHRGELKHLVQEPFAAVLEAVTARLADTELPLSGGKHTMFRMNRDVRFSADKSPYNPHASGVLTRSGIKDEMDGLVYLHMDATGGFVAAGYYRLPPKALGPIRDRIAARPALFRAVLDDLGSAGLALDRGHSLKAMPQGYSAHAGAWFAEYLKLQTFIVRRELEPALWVDGAVVDVVAEFALACGGLIEFGRTT